MAELPKIELPEKKERDPDSYYYKVTAETSFGLVTDYLSGENEQDIKETMAKKYPLKEKEIKSIKTEPISKEEFVKKVKQKYAIRSKREKDW